MERLRGHKTKHSRWILLGPFLKQAKCKKASSETQGEIRVELSIWRYQEILICFRCLVL